MIEGIFLKRLQQATSGRHRALECQSPWLYGKRLVVLMKGNTGVDSAVAKVKEEA